MPSPGTIKIPITKQHLGKMFPQLTREQILALQNDQPLPASPDYIPIASIPDQEIRQQLAVLRKRYISLYGFNATEPWFLDWFWRNPPSLTALPKISAIMVVQAQHKPILVARGMRQFVQQNYPNKQMVLVKAADYTGPIEGHPQIKVVDSSQTGWAASRNFALRHCDADYIAPFWDCDDLYHPWYLTTLMASFREEPSVMLSHQMRLSVLDQCSAAIFPGSPGLASTIAVRRWFDLHFDEDAADEEAAFAVSCLQARVIDAGNYPLNVLRVGVHHAASRRTYDAYFPGLTAGTQNLEAPEQAYAHLLLESVGITVTTREEPA